METNGVGGSNVYQTEASGVVNYSFLGLISRFSVGNRVDIDVDYHYRNIKDNVTQGSGLPYSTDLKSEYARSAISAKHAFTVFARTRLPYGIFLSSIFNADSGTAFDITLGRDLNGDGLFLERPAFRDNSEIQVLVNSDYGQLNVNPQSSSKIIPRNFGNGQARFIFDLKVNKTFKLFENAISEKSYTLNIVSNIDNVFNIDNKSNPIGQVSSPYFLQSVSYLDESIGFLSSKSPRRITFGLYFTF